MTIESLLTNKTDAEAKALRIMQDQSKVRPIITLELEVSKCTNPRIYDMLEAEVSMLQSQPRAKGYYNVIGDPELLDDVLGEWVRDGKMMIVDGKRILRTGERAGNRN